MKIKGRDGGGNYQFVLCSFHVLNQISVVDAKINRLRLTCSLFRLLRHPGQVNCCPFVSCLLKNITDGINHFCACKYKYVFATHFQHYKPPISITEHFRRKKFTQSSCKICSKQNIEACWNCFITSFQLTPCNWWLNLTRSNTFALSSRSLRQ